MVRRFSLAVLLACSLLGAARATEPPDYAALRARMVEGVEAWTWATSGQTGVTELDPRILSALREVPRHLFVPEPLRPLAYGSHPLPLGHDQNLASPFLVGLMTHLAELGANDVVFETGTGSGYHAAVLSRVAAQVYSVEVVGALARQAAETLEELKVGTAHVREGDGYYGWPEHGPYDAIIVKEAVDHLPAPLLNQLKPGGRLVVPLSAGGEEQFLTVVRKTADGALRKTRVLPVRFSPLQGGERT
ncbi:MAG: protein-L-isoaspartate(D-aspartate) O-methyltransferase [Rhodospirillales bacterium]|nr:protein-L-isoaspartate(D-aspartate) O-methyltransferase [Rhodospirillales bacterium]